MKKLLLIMMISIILFLNGCDPVNPIENIDDDGETTSTEFFATTTITEYLLDAELTSSRPVENMEEDYVFFSRLDDTVSQLEHYTYLQADTSNLDDINPCVDEYCTVLMVPLITTDDVNDLSYSIMYDKGYLCINYYGTGDLNTEGNELKVLLVVIDSPYLFEATINQSLCPYYK